MRRKITETQVEPVRRLVRSGCCNCVDGNCLLLGDGEEQTCVQLICSKNCCFKSGLAVYDAKPPIGENLLIYENKYYLIGAKHKNYDGSKVMDDDYYVLTLAAIARELLRENLTSAKLFLAAGLPITWVVKQGAAFRDYLLKNKSVDFCFRGVDYHIDFAGADVFPQGYAAIVDKLRDFSGSHMLCDIGNGTMNILRITDHHADLQQMFTEEFGTKECAAKMSAALMEGVSGRCGRGHSQRGDAQRHRRRG